MNLKQQPSQAGANELDFIYQVLISANQFSSTHGSGKFDFHKNSDGNQLHTISNQS